MSSKQERPPVLNSCKLIAVAVLLLLFPAVHSKKTDMPWEWYVKEGNLDSERARYSRATSYYLSALRLLEKDHVNDLRIAVVHKDLSRNYKAALNPVQARLHEAQASAIYKKEIETRQLGNEYATKEPADLSQMVLKPACPVCHENANVVPIRYGKDNGYSGEVPEEKDIKFTHKPGGPDVGSERWYCKSCLQKY